MLLIKIRRDEFTPSKIVHLEFKDKNIQFELHSFHQRWRFWIGNEMERVLLFTDLNGINKHYQTLPAFFIRDAFSNKILFEECFKQFPVGYDALKLQIFILFWKLYHFSSENEMDKIRTSVNFKDETE